MTVIVENGSRSDPNANSYGDEAGLTAYATARGITLTGDPTTLLIQAMDYVETQQFKGQKYTQAQPLQWPRSGVTIDGFTIDTDEIPKELVTAQYVTAVSIDQGLNPLAVIEPSLKRKKTGPIEKEWQDGASQIRINPEISRAFSKLVSGASGGNVINVTRA